ncbi:hypothetical protein T07_8960 [Trichinella nelsoni]|uniref:Uncharacterized protein n=1 Tax=Trichinella nelsoni TaxID=6336 RepID=A0A0V0SIH9_9BILA|nr:hypothetical protein T07_8960 [Trichinella nelsoni]
MSIKESQIESCDHLTQGGRQEEDSDCCCCVANAHGVFLQQVAHTHLQLDRLIKPITNQQRNQPTNQTN